MKILFLTCYNCSNQIGRVLEKTFLAKKNISKCVWDKIVLIDNISNDNTIEKAIAVIKNLKINNIEILKNNSNYGLGGSHKVAYLFAKKHNASGFIILHGDDQGDILDLNNLTDEYENFAACLGSRFEKNSFIKNYSRFRILGNKIFNYTYSLVLGQKITDMGSGLNFFNLNLIDESDFMSMPDDLTFNNFFLIYLRYKNIPFKFFNISWVEEDQVSNAKLLSQSYKISKYLLAYLFGFFNLFIKKSDINYNYKIIYKN